MTIKRVADAKCPTCGEIAQVTEDTRVTHTAEWVSRTIVMVDRTFHCAGHIAWQREINGNVKVTL